MGFLEDMGKFMFTFTAELLELMRFFLVVAGVFIIGFRVSL
jgi:hypothetical protein